MNKKKYRPLIFKVILLNSLVLFLLILLNCAGTQKQISKTKSDVDTSRKNKAIQEESVIAIKTNKKGDMMKVVEFSPKLPATLKEGEEIKIKILYELSSPDISPLIFAMPPRGSYNIDSSMDQNYYQRKGEANLTIRFKESTEVKKVRIIMIGDKKEILKLTIDKNVKRILTKTNQK